MARLGSASSVVAPAPPPLRGFTGPFIRLSSSLSAGKKSSGNTVILDASLVFSKTTVPVKAKIGLNYKVLWSEHETMSILSMSNGRCFVKPQVGILSGASGDIVGEEGDDLSSYWALVMERGEWDLGEYLNGQHTISDGELRHICQCLTNIVEAAHAKCYVLGDFKVQNIVCCIDTARVDYKAIDFDNTRHEGHPISSDGTSTTPSIASPEMAKLLLAREEGKDPPETKASWASDIFSLGLTLFFIANHKISLWSVLGINDSNKIDFLKASSDLTDEMVEGAVNSQFPRNRALRTVLVDALRVNPVHRKPAYELKQHSFLGSNDPTFNPSQLNKDMNIGFQMLQLSLKEMNEKLDHLAASQSELGIVIR
jgi:serine/threonine protein kinase